MGFFICAAGVLAFPFLTGVAAWSIAAAVIGVGMALLYPTLIAAMGDIASPVCGWSSIWKKPIPASIPRPNRRFDPLHCGLP
ncbi:hypothetical protein M3484_19700 [Pseudomonas sp. GX19020]|uniref:hypothetical protein n=1 Tax=Pseudomonas sp. GX19020 TaxID=2942277 RepID=UPI002019DCF8|nr:hypothetical protein [Pseudomonas sp. GX19020]MCL4068792.1 hypothetical protein [Pseudomonas sp. GX19020]